MYWRDRLACFGARSRGTCTNRLTISRQDVEERVLVALREKLMRRDLFEDFCREYVRELNRLRREKVRSLCLALEPRPAAWARRTPFEHSSTRSCSSPTVSS